MIAQQIVPPADENDSHWIIDNISHPDCIICDRAVSTAIANARVTGSIGGTFIDDRTAVSEGREHIVKVSRAASWEIARSTAVVISVEIAAQVMSSAIRTRDILDRSSFTNAYGKDNPVAEFAALAYDTVVRTGI